jgi:3-deoxy-D-manno-octulosonic-acid transferase
VPPGAPVLLGGSTFPGEEAVLGRVARDLAAEFPDLFLIAVPRHVERAGEAVADLEAAGLAVARRTAPEGKEGCRALAVDTTGELRSWYRVATVVFVGKSLLSKGGQNPVEPIVAGKPVLFGPHMENFAPLAGQLADKGGALAVADEAALAGAVRRLLRSPEERERMAAAGLRVVDAHRGATDRTARFLLGMRRQPT